MRLRPDARWWWVAAWLAGTLFACAWLGRAEFARLHEAFETDARIIHRLLSQRAVQHDAVLATLALMGAAVAPARDGPPGQRLASVYPQITAASVHPVDGGWQPAVPAAVARPGVLEESRRGQRAVLADARLSQGQVWIAQAAEPVSHALRIDLMLMVPWADWPMPDQGRGSPVRVVLEHAGERFVLQPGSDEPGISRFEFHKHLASQSQPFDVVVTREVGWLHLPWLRMFAAALTWAALLAVVAAWQAQRRERRRAEELLRLGQVGRLNTLGELAAGLAHELNQPLTAVLANTQAAARLLDDDPPELDTAREAMQQAAAQARRASEVVARLRRGIERPDAAAAPGELALDLVAARVLYLLQPELERRKIDAAVEGETGVAVLADAVALEQIVHNLVSNAMQALERMPDEGRRLRLAISREAGRAALRVSDTGPGVPAADRARVFEPFFSTREGGLGLGLSLCESLAAGMGGELVLEPAARGAVFRLTLPLKDSP